jgi:hypothetical protein
MNETEAIAKIAETLQRHSTLLTKLANLSLDVINRLGDANKTGEKLIQVDEQLVGLLAYQKHIIDSLELRVQVLEGKVK